MGKTKVQKIGFLVGIVAMLVIGFMPTPEGLSLVGQRVLAVTVLMVVFWITEPCRSRSQRCCRSSCSR